MKPITYIRRGGDFGQFAEVTLKRAAPHLLLEVHSTDEADRSFIFLPVLDYQRLAKPEDQGRIGLLQPEDIAALRDGRAALILDLSNEGPAFDVSIFDTLHGNLDKSGIPRERCIFVSQNRLLKAQYERTYPDGLRFWNLEYFVSLLALWLDAEKSSESFGDQSYSPGDYAPMVHQGQAASFLCQNAAVRWHRALVYRWLQIRDMLDVGVVSFHGIDPANTKAHEFDITSPPRGLADRFPELVENVENWIPRSARRIDGGGWGNDLVVSLDLDAYARTDLTIITETDFFVEGILRVTEKSVKAAASGNPFLLVGAPHSISRISELGFCAFDGMVDHGYDLISDPLDRLSEVFRSIALSWELCSRDPHRWRLTAKEVADFNFSHAREHLRQRVFDLIERPFLKRMELFQEVGILIK